MPSSLALPPEIRNHLENARQVLGLSQERLSAMANISQANVSNCLKGRAVRVESLQRLLGAFDAALAAAPKQGVSPEQAQGLREGVEAARKLLEGTVESAPYLARPGGAMPENATNRIQRPEDQLLVAALADAPFTAAVTGPPECGKSTLLQLLASEARRRGFAVTEFDVAVLPEPPSVTEEEGEENLHDLSKKFYRELCEEVGRTIGEKSPERVETRFDLMRFLKETRLRRPVPPLLIVVDHTSQIPLALEELALVCRSLDSQKGRTQISWALEASDQPVRARLGSLSRLSPSPLVELGWFTLEQVRELAWHYDIEAQDRIKELWDWFLGQPFLTHAALNRFRDLPLSLDRAATWEKLIAEIEKGGEAEIGQHLVRVKAQLDQNSPWKLLPSFPTKAEWEDQMKDAAIIEALKRLGVVRPGESVSLAVEDIVPKFYRHHLMNL